MSAGRDFASIRSLGTVEGVCAVPAHPFNPTAMSELVGSSVVRSPEQLRLHRALEGIGWTGVIVKTPAAILANICGSVRN
jgi:hypothetical protein